MPTTSEVSLVFAGDDPEDLAFAEGIARSVRVYARARLIDTDEFDRAQQRGEARRLRWRGATVFVLSPAMVGKAHNRKKLVKSCPQFGLTGYDGFYICRGTSVGELRRKHPDLSELFDKVMIGEENQLRELLSEIRLYVANPALRLKPTSLLLTLGRYVTELPLVALIGLGLVLLPVPFVAFGTSAGLVFVLLFQQTVPGWLVSVAVCVSMFGAGWWASKVPAMDLWPWLGRRWRPAMEAREVFASVKPPAALVKRWLIGGCLAPASDPASGYDFTSDELACAEAWWHDTALKALGWLLLRSGGLLIPAVLAASRQESLLGAGLACLITGLLFRSVSAQADHRIARIHHRNAGLTDREFGRTDGYFDPTRPLNLGVVRLEGLPGSSSNRDQVLMDYWLRLQTLWSDTAPSRLTRLKERVFISYGWTDPADVDYARELTDVLVSSRLPVFLDRREIAPFALWRPEVSERLFDATHVILVLGRAALKGQVWRREAKSVIRRWYTELHPAVICVAETETVDALRADPDVPVEVRFLLAWSPVVRRRDALRPGLMRALIRQRRRRGIINSWAAILCPPLALKSVRRSLLSSWDEKGRPNIIEPTKPGTTK